MSLPESPLQVERGLRASVLAAAGAATVILLVTFVVHAVDWFSKGRVQLESVDSQLAMALCVVAPAAALSAFATYAIPSPIAAGTTSRQRFLVAMAVILFGGIAGASFLYSAFPEFFHCRGKGLNQPPIYPVEVIRFVIPPITVGCWVILVRWVQAYRRAGEAGLTPAAVE